MIDQRTAVVLGGFGLVGSGIANALADGGFTVVRAGRSCEPGASSRKVDILDLNQVSALLDELRPSVVVNAVNLATSFAKDPSAGYPKIIAFYEGLSRILQGCKQDMHYIHIGTTGMGGMGTNNPFSSANSKALDHLFNKAAFAGISSSLLLLMSRSFPRGNVRVSEVKPGRAIFGEKVKAEDVYGVSLVTLDGGEGGDYTYQETMLISRFMGFKPVSRLARIVADIVSESHAPLGFASGDSVAAANTAVISQDAEDTAIQERLDSEMRRLIGTRPAVVTRGTLVSPQMTRDLLLATGIVNRCTDIDAVRREPSVNASLACIAEAKPDLHAYLEETMTEDRLRSLRPYCGPGIDAWQAVEAITRAEFGLQPLAEQ